MTTTTVRTLGSVANHLAWTTDPFFDPAGRMTIRHEDGRIAVIRLTQVSGVSSSGWANGLSAEIISPQVGRIDYRSFKFADYGINGGLVHLSGANGYCYWKDERGRSTGATPPGESNDICRAVEDYLAIFGFDITSG